MAVSKIHPSLAQPRQSRRSRTVHALRSQSIGHKENKIVDICQCSGGGEDSEQDCDNDACS